MDIQGAGRGGKGRGVCESGRLSFLHCPRPRHPDTDLIGGVGSESCATLQRLRIAERAQDAAIAIKKHIVDNGFPPPPVVLVQMLRKS